ncbi:MAG TPA: hypothetical protein VKP30_22175 [Polyangiaceae bacterium]|nr:hypothetical protein [Polyangiaceae bacterium]
MRAGSKIVSVLGAGIFLAGCSGTEGGSDASPNQSVGGAGVGGSTTAVVPAVGGATQTNGQSGLGGRSVSGTTSNRGATVGGTQAKGGSSNDGSDAEGGSTSEGGTTSIAQTTSNGGAISSRGSTTKSGNTSKGGATGSTGSTVVGGTSSKGGPSSKGGTATTVGGTSSTNGTSSKGGTTNTGGSSGGATSTSVEGTSDAKPSTGCGKTPTLKSGTITLGSRNYILKLPQNYDATRPYRLILGLHGYGGSSTNIQSEKYFGLEPLSNGSTIFIAPNAVSGNWNASTDVTFVDDILKQVEADLCIDTSRIMLEGFSQGAAMSWSIACTSKNVFRAVIGHSGGGVANPTSCKAVAYLGSLGLGESGNSQKTQTDQFAKWNGCTIETLPTAAKGTHVCTNYNGCPALAPVRWCSYDGGHTSAPTDSGQGTSWMPKEVWAFVSNF